MEITIHNATTGEVETRKMTKDEVAYWTKVEADLAAERAEAEAKKQALLDKLGITADEARLLLS